VRSSSICAGEPIQRPGVALSIADENRRPGTSAWWLAPHAAPRAIEGYSTQPSVVAGDTLELCVSTRPARRYRIGVFRLGWYQGDGGRLMATPPGNVGLPREAPLADVATGLVQAGWPVTDVVLTDESWPSGQYVAVLELTTGAAGRAAPRGPVGIRAVPG
jgi:hypothetical protein